MRRALAHRGQGASRSAAEVYNPRAPRPLRPRLMRGADTVKFLLDNWFLIVIALTSGGLLAWPSLSGGGKSGVTPAEAVQLVNREKGVLIDICEPAEYAVAHVAGARNIPLGTLESSKATAQQQSPARGAGVPKRRTLQPRRRYAAQAGL